MFLKDKMKVKILPLSHLMLALLQFDPRDRTTMLAEQQHGGRNFISSLRVGQI